METHSTEPGLRGFLVSVGSLMSARLFLAVSQILVLPILARQLSVEEFGLMGLAMTIVVFSITLSDGGMGRSLIRTDSADPIEWSSVNWLMTLAGVVCAMCVVLVARFAGHFFQSPDLPMVLYAMSVIPLFYAVTAAPNAEVERRENYAGIARVQVIATIAGLAFAVVGAVMQLGVWALVGQQILLAGVRMVGILFLSHFRPSFTFSMRGMSPHLVYARDTIAATFVTTIRHQVPVMMISRYLGQVPLGYWSMCHRFSRLPQFGIAGPVSTVIYVRMSKAKDCPERLSEIYYAGMRLMATLLIPTTAIIAVAGVPIFNFLLSSEWAPVARLFALSIGGLVLEAVAIFFMHSLFRAVARTDLVLRTSVEGAILLLVLVFICVQVSLEAVALSFTVWSLIMVPRHWQLGAKLAPISYSRCVAQLLPSLAAAILVCLSYLALEKTTSFADFLYMGIAMGLGILGVGLAFMLDRENSKSALDAFRSQRSGFDGPNSAVSS